MSSAPFGYGHCESPLPASGTHRHPNMFPMRTEREHPTCYPTSVRKTSVYLDDADARRLAGLAQREGVSQASLLRRAIRAYVPEARADRSFALDGSGEGPGDSIADLDADALFEGFGG